MTSGFPSLVATRRHEKYGRLETYDTHICVFPISGNTFLNFSANHCVNDTARAAFAEAREEFLNTAEA